jgi:hypothetical protein
MDTDELMELLKQVEPHRDEEVLFDGDRVPKSAAMLATLLETATDPDDRYDIYGHIVVECLVTEKSAVAVKFALARYQEFGDVTSLVAYSKALVKNGDLTSGLLRAREALNLAIQKQTLINYAAGNLVRESIKTGTAVAVNEALEDLVSSTQVPRTGDCALEVDWADKAERLGADLELIAWVRSVAARK